MVEKGTYKGEMASGNHRKYDIAMQRGSTEKPALFGAVCAGASSPVTGS